MKTVSVHEAKTHLSALIEKAVTDGEGFIISKSGKPMVRVTRVEAPVTKKRTGFLIGQIQVPDDFDAMAAEQIQADFEGKP
jgi:prevent-host-death family protein